MDREPQGPVSGDKGSLLRRATVCTSSSPRAAAQEPTPQDTRAQTRGWAAPPPTSSAGTTDCAHWCWLWPLRESLPQVPRLKTAQGSTVPGLSAKDPSPPPLQGTRCSWEHRASLAGRCPLPGLALLDFPAGGGRAGHSCRQSLASGCAFLWRGEACTPGCDRDVQGVAAASQGRVSMRAVQKRSLQETMGRREQRQVPEQAGRHAEDWEGGHPRGLDVFHRTFTRPGDWGSLPSPTC